MKNDINLLYKRKKNKYPRKKLAGIIIGMIIILGCLYAGIALPSQALTVARLEVKNLDGNLVTASMTEQELTQKTQYNSTLKKQLEELKLLNGSKTDIATYLNAVQQSLPSNANILMLSLSDRTMNISGIAKDDAVLAIFCIKLKETNIFDNIFISNSTTSMDGNETSFSLYAALPSSLSTASLIQDKEKTDTSTQVNRTEVKEGSI
ncbi:MAG: PilN domain-containing protein [Christensenellales bacterium]|jgi:Tfp pilus assembly protein PilN